MTRYRIHRSLAENLWRSAAMLIVIMIALGLFIRAAAEDGDYISESNYLYITANLNPAYIESADLSSDRVTECAYLPVKNTYITEEAAEQYGSLTEYFDMVHASGTMPGYVFTAEARVPLYDISPSSDYVVGIVDEDALKATDHIFAENNYEGRELPLEYYDGDTGLAYIRKEDLYTVQDGEILINYVQLQCLRIYEPGGASIKTDGETVTADPLSPEVCITMDETPEPEDVQVYVNGESEPLQPSEYSVSGNQLTINTSPANISEVHVETENSLLARAAEAVAELFRPVTAYALTESDNAVTTALGSWQGTVSVGDYVTFTARGVNTESGIARNYIQSVAGSAPGQSSFYDELISRDGDAASSYVYGTYNGSKKNVYKSTYNATYGINMNTALVTDTNNNYMKQWLSAISGTIQMSCIEVRRARYQDFGKNSALHFTALVTGVTDRYIAVSFCSAEKTSSGSSNQVLCGTYAVKYEPRSVSLHYDIGDGTWKTANHIEACIVRYGDEFTVQTLKIADEPELTGYAFMGWSDSTTGDTDYIGGETIESLSLSDGSKILHARWVRAGTERICWSEYLEETLYASEDTSDLTEVTLPVPVHYRYRFKGYYLVEGYDEQGSPVLGIQLTDEQGNLITDNYEGLLQDGTYINKQAVTLWAVFDDTFITPTSFDETDR